MSPRAPRLPVAVTVPAALLIFTLTLAAFDLQHDTAQVLAAVQQGAATTLRDRGTELQGSLQRAFEVDDLPGLADEVSGLGADVDLTQALAVDDQGLVVGSLHLADLRQPVAALALAVPVDPALAQAARDRGAAVDRLSASGDALSMYWPLELPSRGHLRANRTGLLMVERDLRRARAVALYGLRWEVANRTARMLAFALLLAVFFQLTFTRRLSRVVAAAKRLGEGDLGVRARLTGADEVAQLGLGFDAMADDLQAHHQRLVASEERGRVLLDSTAEAILGLDPAGAVTFCNRAALRLLERPEDRVLGQPLHALLGEGGGSPGLFTSGESEDPHRGGLLLAGAEREPVELDCWIRPVTHDGVRQGTVVTLVDVTERNRLQQRLLTTDRLASMGTLAAGVAHEINNPLSYAMTNVQFALGELGEDPRFAEPREALSDAADGLRRVRDIVVDLKRFSLSDTTDSLRPVDVRAVVQRALALADNELRHRATLVKDLQPAPLVLANEARLGQVVLNLLVNAAQALAEGREQNEVRVVTGADAEGRARVEVSDTGVGMPPSVLRRIFDPFFTTKPQGVGTGLGLSICHGIVASFGGVITVESTVGKGSRFCVALPPAPVGQGAVQVPSPPPAAPRRLQVLVVDDEPMIVTAVRRLLDAEHAVQVESSAKAAWARLEAGARYDVLLCDVMMPGMSGLDLYEKLQQQLPGQAARMVFITGGAFTERAARFFAEHQVLRLDKPFTRDDLRACLARVCDLVESGPIPL